METQPLILKFKDKEEEFSFENNVFVIDNKKLIQNLSRPNIKNQDSSLLIKSLNDTHISDVVQIKINVGETGFFLTSFNKKSLTEEIRNKLLEDIGNLKNSESPSIESQTKKTRELLEILNENAPIYASFVNNGEIKINLEEIVDFELNFPLLVLKQPEKKFIFKIEKKEKQDKAEKTGKIKKEKKERVQKEYQAFPLFDSDYLFAMFFAMLASFSVTASVFEVMNNENVSTFLIVLASILTITLVLSLTSIVYKKGELRNPWLRYYVGIFVLIGLVGGVIASFFVCKNLLKTEIEDFDYKKMILISSLISASLILSLSLIRIVNLFNKLLLKKKSH